MSDMVKLGKNKGNFLDFGRDFILLTSTEKRKVLRTAKTYWKLLKDNDALRTDGESPLVLLSEGGNKRAK